jgi:menaquinone-dependent protoporphyrinogen oxidase
MLVLVGYASEHGSTRGIAERIGTQLADQGHQVDVKPLDQAGSPDGYDAVVLGSAIHNQAWLKRAADYVRDNRTALGGRPVWLFSVGLARVVGGWFERHGTEPKGIPAIREAIHACDHRLLAGAVEPDHLPRIGRLIYKAVGGRYGDFRDWAEVSSWAAQIGRTLMEGTAPSGGPKAAETWDRGAASAGE